MKEIFIIYNKTTGFVDGGIGRIERDKDAAIFDGSSVSDYVARTVSKKSDRAVLYILETDDLPDPEEIIIKNGQIKQMSESEKDARKAVLPKTKIQLLEERIAELESRLNT